MPLKVNRLNLQNLNKSKNYFLLEKINDKAIQFKVDRVINLKLVFTDYIFITRRY